MYTYSSRGLQHRGGGRERRATQASRRGGGRKGESYTMSSAERAQSDERPTDSFSGHSVTCHSGLVFVPWAVRGLQQAPASPYNVHRGPYVRLYFTNLNLHCRFSPRSFVVGDNEGLGLKGSERRSLCHRANALLMYKLPSNTHPLIIATSRSATKRLS